MSDKLDLAAIEAMYEGATPPPWGWGPDGLVSSPDGSIGSWHNYLLDGENRVNNVLFILNSRTLIPALVAKVRELEKPAEGSNDELLAKLWNCRGRLEQSTNELFEERQSVDDCASELESAYARVRELEAQLAEANARLDVMGAR